MYLASGMQRLELNQRWDVLDALVRKKEDAKDHNLPLMLWYAAEPLVDININKSLQLAEKSEIPKLLEYMIQRVDALQTDEAKKTLKELKNRLTTNSMHKHHMEM